MTTYERRRSLIELLRRQHRLRVPEIAQMLALSKGTVRNDLKALGSCFSVARGMTEAHLEEARLKRKALESVLTSRKNSTRIRL